MFVVGLWMWFVFVVGFCCFRLVLLWLFLVLCGCSNWEWSGWCVLGGVGWGGVGFW